MVKTYTEHLNTYLLILLKNRNGIILMFPAYLIDLKQTYCAGTNNTNVSNRLYSKRVWCSLCKPTIKQIPQTQLTKASFLYKEHKRSFHNMLNQIQFLFCLSLWVNHSITRVIFRSHCNQDVEYITDHSNLLFSLVNTKLQTVSSILIITFDR